MNRQGWVSGWVLQLSIALLLLLFLCTIFHRRVVFLVTIITCFFSVLSRYTTISSVCGFLLYIYISIYTSPPPPLFDLYTFWKASRVLKIPRIFTCCCGCVCGRVSYHDRLWLLCLSVCLSAYLLVPQVRYTYEVSMLRTCPPTERLWRMTVPVSTAFLRTGCTYLALSLFYRALSRREYCHVTCFCREKGDYLSIMTMR